MGVGGGGGSNSVNIVYLPSGNGSTLRKEFVPLRSKSFPFRVGTFVCSKANRKSQKMSPLYKMAENLSSVSSPLNDVSQHFACWVKKFSRRHFEMLFFLFPRK